MIKNIIANYFYLILLVACGVGLVVPDPGGDTAYLILVALFTTIFFSYFQLDIKPEYKDYSVKTIVFCLLRFVVMPVIIVIVGKIFQINIAFLCLLLLLPSGVSVPGITRLIKGNAEFAFFILFFSNIISVFFIPLLSKYFITADNLSVKPVYLFRILFITVILPFILHLFFRKWKKLKSWASSNYQYVSVINLTIIFIIAIARNKKSILDFGSRLLPTILVALLVYALLYLIGYFMNYTREKPLKKAYSIGSGLNNVGLGVSITTLYFSSELAVLFVIAQFAWVIILTPVKSFLSRME